MNSDNSSSQLKEIEDLQFAMSNKQFTGGDSLITKIISTDNLFDFAVTGLEPFDAQNNKIRPKFFYLVFTPKNSKVNAVMCDIKLLHSTFQDVMAHIGDYFDDDWALRDETRAMPISGDNSRRWRVSLYNTNTDGGNITAYIKIVGIASTEGTFSLVPA